MLCIGCRQQEVRPPARYYCSRACACRATGRNGRARVRNPPHEFDCGLCRTHVVTWHRMQRFCSLACSAWGRYKPPHRKGGNLRGFAPDLNQQDVVEAYKARGAGVIDTSHIGSGFPDLIVGYAGRNHLVEVKNPRYTYGRRGLSSRQQAFAAEGWRIHVVRSVPEALAVIGL